MILRKRYFVIWFSLLAATLAVPFFVEDQVQLVDSPIARLESHSGSVLFRSPSLATWVEAVDGQQFSRATVVATLNGARALLRFPSGRDLELLSDSQIELSFVDEMGEGDTILNLLHGKFTLSRLKSPQRGSVWGGFSGSHGFKIRVGDVAQRVDGDDDRSFGVVHAEGESRISAGEVLVEEVSVDRNVVVEEVPTPVATGTPVARIAPTSSSVRAFPRPGKTAEAPSVAPPRRVIRVALFERDGIGGIYSSGLQDFGWSDIPGVQLIEISPGKLSRLVYGVEPEASPVLFFSQVFEVAGVDRVIIIGSRGEDSLVIGRDADGQVRLRRVVVTTAEMPSWLAKERERMEQGGH
jgi:hypothetical protein